MKPFEVEVLVIVEAESSEEAMAKVESALEEFSLPASVTCWGEAEQDGREGQVTDAE